MTEDSMHRTLTAALARNSGPSAEDVWSLLRLMNHDGGRIGCNHAGGRCSALSDWLAAHTAAAEACGVNDGIRLAARLVRDHVLGETGERVADFLIARAARKAAARVGGEAS